MALRILDITDFLTEKTGFTVYPVQFPQDKSEAVKAMIISSDGEGDGVKNITIEEMSRAYHPAKAEELLHEVIEVIGLEIDIDHNDYQIILARALSEPQFEGESKSGYYLFSCDFQILVSRLGD